MDQDTIEAKFDPKVKTYWFLSGVWLHLLLLTMGIGLFTLPLWCLGLGQWVSKRRYEQISANLTHKAIHLRTGAFVRVEKTIPLEQIQDLSLRTGPILDRLGIASVRVETAGQAVQGGADMVLPGIVDARAFRDAVLARRDALVEGRRQPEPSTPATDEVDETTELLRDIRDTLHRLEARLEP